MALLGLVVGIMRFKPHEAASACMASIPYAGWMRWHFVTGAVFGVFTLTWVFSGLLSMEPFAWTNATGLEFEREVMTGGPLELARFPKAEPAAGPRMAGDRAIKEVELTRIQDEPYYVVRLGFDAAAGAARAPAPALSHHRARRGGSPAGVGRHDDGQARAVQRRVDRRSGSRPRRRTSRSSSRRS